ncbi:unnamed protein product [Anisakis simplex]|uniref:PX domain-containing protein n=1 Tax=Anisakis simplex TaxID=6269 RepID=A0A0M3K6B9_ANISI|nr:unnamed protein product [Anisakis simplex]
MKEYVIEVEALIGNARKWSVERRYTQFREMNKNLEKFGVELGFPPKKAIGNTKEQFIVQRKEALQKFLDKICSHSLFYSSPAVVSFLDVLPDSFTVLDEWILLSVRDKPEWRLGERHVNCGWRAAKTIHELKCGQSALVLSAVRYGPDRCGDIETLNETLNFMRSLDYAYIGECISSWADDKGVLSVYRAFDGGSLRDHLYKSNWRDEFFVKYCVDRTVYSLEIVDIRFICRQILEALSLFCALSIPFIDIHSGNISISDCGCELIDAEQEPILKSIFAPETRSLPTLVELISNDIFVDTPVAKMNRREIRMPANVKQLLDGLCDNICKRLQSDRAQVPKWTKTEEDSTKSIKMPKNAWYEKWTIAVMKQNKIQREEKMRKLLLSEGEKLRRKQIVKSVSFIFSITSNLITEMKFQSK